MPQKAGCRIQIVFGKSSQLIGNVSFRDRARQTQEISETGTALKLSVQIVFIIVLVVQLICGKHTSHF